MSNQEEINEEETHEEGNDSISEDEDEGLDYFFSGNSLNTDEAYDVMKAFHTNMVIIAGPVGSGKTTLLSAIYEKFQMGDNTIYDFSGSRTLLGFEKCTHYSRLASSRREASSPRTRYEDEYNFLHIEVCNRGNAEKKNILLSDVSGEKFEKIIASSAECYSNEIISRADHFVYVIDGEKLLSPIPRETCISDCLTTIRRLAETGILLNLTKICILISKSDIIHKCAPTEKQKVEDIVEKLINVKLPNATKANSFDISASWICAQNNSKTDLQDSKIIEVEKLLSEWIQYSSESRIEICNYIPQKDRMINKYVFTDERHEI